MDPAAQPEDAIATERTEEHAAPPRLPSATDRSRKRKVPPSGLNERTTFPRKRSVTACQLCRSRKTKCNNGRPICSQCLSLNAQCVYEEDEASAAAAAPASQILERLDYLITLVEPCSGIVGVRRASSRETVGVPLVRHLRASYSSNGRRASTTALRSDVASEDNESDTPRHAYFGSGQDILDWPVFEGRYDRRWIEALIFDPTLPCIDLSGPCTSPRVTDDTTRNTYKDPRQASGLGVGVREDDVLHLVEAFLVNVHVKNPIFDPEYLRSMAKGVAEDGFNWQASSCLVVRNRILVRS